MELVAWCSTGNVTVKSFKTFERLKQFCKNFKFYLPQKVFDLLEVDLERSSVL